MAYVPVDVVVAAPQFDFVIVGVWQDWTKIYTCIMYMTNEQAIHNHTRAAVERDEPHVGQHTTPTMLRHEGVGR